MPNFSPPRSRHAHDVFRLFLIILVVILAIGKADEKADLTEVSIAKGEIRSKWEKNDMQAATNLPSKLLYASIADLTGIDKKTVRRTVKKLTERGWFGVVKKIGIHYNPIKINQNKLVMCNEWELDQFGRLLTRFDNARNAH
jgi:hypothetical protein